MNSTDNEPMTPELGRILMVVYGDATRLRDAIRMARENGATEKQIAGHVGVSMGTLAKIAPVVQS